MGHEITVKDHKWEYAIQYIPTARSGGNHKFTQEALYEYLHKIVDTSNESVSFLSGSVLLPYKYKCEKYCGYPLSSLKWDMYKGIRGRVKWMKYQFFYIKYWCKGIKKYLRNENTGGGFVDVERDMILLNKVDGGHIWFPNKTYFRVPPDNPFEPWLRVLWGIWKFCDRMCKEVLDNDRELFLDGWGIALESDREIPEFPGAYLFFLDVQEDGVKITPLIYGESKDAPKPAEGIYTFSWAGMDDAIASVENVEEIKPELRQPK